jgi:D-alanyl-D-alanine carboxypeptidase
MFAHLFLAIFVAIFPIAWTGWFSVNLLADTTLARVAEDQVAFWAKPSQPHPDADVLGVKVVVSVPGPKLVEQAFDLQVNASSCLAIDVASGAVLYAEEPDHQQAIASITKLMTALVFLEHNPGWDTSYTFTAADNRSGGKVYFFPGDVIKVKDLFFGMLVASDNAAVAGLVHSTGLSEEQFVGLMNDKAVALGLTNTQFADPTGLHNANLSTARDVATFAKAALAEAAIQEAVLADSYDFTTEQGDSRQVHSTDKLLTGRGRSLRIEGGKTGYLQSSGYCFVGRFSKDQHPIIAVVLGAPDINARFTETKKIVDWAFASYQWEDR